LISEAVNLRVHVNKIIYRRAAEKNIKPKCGKKTCNVKSQEIG
jgi:hypothetical protein